MKIRYFISIFLFMAIFFSCTRLERKVGDENYETTSEIEHKFFNSFKSYDYRTEAIKIYLYQLNSKSHFVERTAKQIGFPRWDKMMVTTPDKVAQSLVEQNVTDSSVTYYLPFSRPNENFVNAAMVIAVEPNDTAVSYMLDWQYKLMQNLPNGINDSAERFALHFMIMDKITFGTKQFSILDPSLFKTNGKTANTLKLSDSNSSSNNLVLVQYCQNVTVYFNDCTYPDTQDCTPTCDKCWLCTSHYSYQYCWEDWEDEGSGGGSGGSGGGSGGGGSGGSGGGSGGTPYYPPIPPCTSFPQGCIVGWAPDEDNNPPSPYNPSRARPPVLDTSITNNFPCVKKIMDSLKNYLNVNAIAQTALHEVFDINKKINTEIKVNWNLTKDSADATTEFDLYDPRHINGQFYATIKLNPWMLRNSTQEYITSTIIHEVYHAFIDFKAYQFRNNLIDSNHYKALFPLHWPPRYRNTNGLNAYPSAAPQHIVMASNLIDIMAAPLYNLFPNDSLSTGKKDSLYRALSWGGLGRTTVWRQKADTNYIKAFNAVARDTGIVSPFQLLSNGIPAGDTFRFNSKNLNMKRVCN
jgi:uncharacterized membrane protein YgcG